MIGLRLGSLLLGTGRIVYNFGNLERSEICQLGFKAPEFLVRDRFVEASRFATDPRFRRRDIFKLLLSCAFRLAYLSGHRYVLIDCEDALVPVYRRLGARKLAQKVIHPLEGVELNVLYFDLKRLARRLRILRKVPVLSRYFLRFFSDVALEPTGPF
jgi:GNAT superfamily N-acetyltransferase